MRSINMKRRAAVVAAFGVVVGLGIGTNARQAQDPLDQGWDEATKDAFWYGSQGSQIMRESWFKNLEQGDNEKPLRERAFLEKLGFIGGNGDRLPIGFAVDTDRRTGAKYIGLTCAACHTARLNIDGRQVIVEGGQSMVDFSRFLDEMVASTDATWKDDVKFKRFAGKLNVPETGYQRLRDELGELNRQLTDRRDQNKPTEPYGFARVDAFGHIFNRVFSTAISVPENAAVPDAPVSYPFLWDTPDPMHRKVQWNWSAPNALLGDESRNVGELLGVFGVFDLRDSPLGAAYYPKSSVDLRKLRKLEGYIKDLRSPVWPGGLTPKMAIDRDAAAQGQAIYENKCQGCHKLIEPSRTASKRKAHDSLVPIDKVGTDPKMTENHHRRTSTDELKTGILQGRAKLPFGRLGDREPGQEILEHVIVGVMLPQFGRGKARQEGLELSAQTVGYKARSLNGIWATAPYLHNGSVPTLADLLNEKRVDGFWISPDSKFDPENVGILSEKIDGAFWFNTSKDGNRNIGHTGPEFGTDLTPQQKKALIEYLKTL